MTFGTREPREQVIGEMAYTVLLCARDLGRFSTVEICHRVIRQLRTGQSPKLSDIRTISLASRDMFR